jgi:hypothetical protein
VGWQGLQQGLEGLQQGWVGWQGLQQGLEGLQQGWEMITGTDAALFCCRKVLKSCCHASVWTLHVAVSVHAMWMLRSVCKGWKEGSEGRQALTHCCMPS